MPDLKPGDWVRFVRDGRLVISEVRYILPKIDYLRPHTVVTDLGSVNSLNIHEVRREPVREDN